MEEPKQNGHDATAVESNVVSGFVDHDEPSTDMQYDPAYEARRQRILDHRLESQADASTLTACMAGVNSDLLDFQLTIGETFRRQLTAGSASLDELERCAPLFNMTLRFAKQITQIAQFEQRSRKNSEQPAAAERQ